MKISELIEKSDAIRQRAVLVEVNAIYLANREEFETTTVCDSVGNVSYTCGAPPEVKVTKPAPAWKIRANQARTEANIRAVERAYPR